MSEGDTPLAVRSTKATQYLASFWPAPVNVNAAERWRAFMGAGFGIIVTALLSRWWAGPLAAGPWLVAPLGASAVLVFAVPSSPLAQPWSVIGGNTLSALVGTLCAMWIGDPAWAGAAAVAVAIALMFSLRCLHPPGGATALFAALGAASFHFALFPMLVNSVLLVLAGVLYNTFTGRRYPHAQGRPVGAATAPAARFTEADLDAALAHYNQVLDVSRDDLEELLHHAESAAYQRNFGSLRCKDIMTREPITVRPGTPLRDAWLLMRQKKVKALPVVDKSRHVVGIVTVADYMRHADLEEHEGIGVRLRALMRRGGSLHAAAKPEVVGQIMTRTVRVASEEKQLAELVPLFSEGGHHHIPVIDADRYLTGIITQTDLVRSLYRAAKPEA